MLISHWYVSRPCYFGSITVQPLITTVQLAVRSKCVAACALILTPVVSPLTTLLVASPPSLPRSPLPTPTLRLFCRTVDSGFSDALPDVRLEPNAEVHRSPLSIERAQLVLGNATNHISNPNPLPPPRPASAPALSVLSTF